MSTDYTYDDKVGDLLIAAILNARANLGLGAILPVLHPNDLRSCHAPFNIQPAQAEQG